MGIFYYTGAKDDEKIRIEVKHFNILFRKTKANNKVN